MNKPDAVRTPPPAKKLTLIRNGKKRSFILMGPPYPQVEEFVELAPDHYEWQVAAIRDTEILVTTGVTHHPQSYKTLGPIK